LAAAIDWNILIFSAQLVEPVIRIIYMVWKDRRRNSSLYLGIDPEKDLQIMIDVDTSEADVTVFH